MFPRWEYSLFQSWFRRTLAFQKPLAFLSEIINCFTNIFDSKQLKYSPKVYIFALRRENGNSKKKWAAIFGQRRQIAYLFLVGLGRTRVRRALGTRMRQHTNSVGPRLSASYVEETGRKNRDFRTMDWWRFVTYDSFQCITSGFFPNQSRGVVGKFYYTTTFFQKISNTLSVLSCRFKVSYPEMLYVYIYLELL
jgi:hypothetical protein